MDVLNIILYIAIAFSGAVFGSFFTLAVHRIPLHQDITHQRSYCPNCNHKLQFLDLIPIFSYILLGGKCRYCGNKIRPRYLILEICSSLFFLAFALCSKLTIESTPVQFIAFGINILFICVLFIVAGIDKDKGIIPNSVLIYGLVVCLIKIVFEVVLLCQRSVINLSIFDGVYRFRLINLIIPLVLLFIDVICTKVFKMEKEPFGYGDIKYLIVLGLFFGENYSFIIGFILTNFITPFFVLFEAIKDYIVARSACRQESDKEIIKLKLPDRIPYGFYLSVAFCIIMILEVIS